MKKYLPIILFLAGLVVVASVFFVIRGRGKTEVIEDKETALIDVALADRPFVSLTPTDEGHYLSLKITKIDNPGAETMEYFLLYDVPGGVPQGVPGMVDIKGLSSFETELLLGTESSGKFRYDEGVEEGTMTIRFRNRDGKMLVKFVSKFHMQNGVDDLSSIDGEFMYIFDKTPETGYFVTMSTIGLPGGSVKDIKEGPFGVFASLDPDLPGEVMLNSGNMHQWKEGEWIMLEDNKTDSVGVFITAS